MSRYYVHTASSVPAAQQHTVVYRPDSDSATIQQLVDAFLSDYHTAKQQHIALDARDDAITNAAGDRLKPTDAASTRLEDRDDVFLAVHNAPPPPATAAATKPTPSASKAPAAARREHTAQERELIALFERAAKLYSDNKLNSALNLYNQITSDTAPAATEDIRTLRRTAHARAATIHYNCQRYAEARDRVNKAVALLSLSYRLPPAEGGRSEREKEEGRMEEAELFALLGRCHLHLKEWDEAELAVTTAIERLAALKDGKSKAVERVVARRRQDYEVLHVRVLYECGDERRKREAGPAMERLIGADAQHVPSLVYYAQMAVDSNNGVAVIPYLLRAVVNLQQLKGGEVDGEVAAQTYALFARMVSLPTGLDALMEGLGHAAKMSSSLCFLASTLKDASAVSAAVGLYRKALAITGVGDQAGEERVSVWLSLVHTLEVLADYEGAWKELRKWLQGDRAREVAGLSLDKAWDVVKDVDTLAYSADMLTDKSGKCPHWQPIPPLFDEGEIQVAIPAQPASASSPSTSMVPAHKHIPAALTSAIKPHPLYSPATLNRLAMLFTMVKLLYVNGVLQPIPALVALLEPTRERKELHLTLIRNEHAYYSTVAQLCRHVPYPVPLAPQQPSVYVLGDSHCLSPAWSTLSLGGTTHLLRPVLVTGTKAWHLRDDCTFYTHANYLAARASIPSSPPPAALVFCFGEIDCREGLLQAVDKAKYPSVEAAIDRCVDVYLEQALSVGRAKGVRAGRLFVQPVMPILDVTRGVVTLFNSRLRRRVEAEKRLRWLGMECDLVGADGKFEKRYSLDGTHVHPQYVQLIEREMSKQW